MVGRDITPTEIGKHAKLIKTAQEEMATMDVLVCGRCLNVYHFIEDFDDHKQKPCQKENTNVRECNDTKPKIWAFLLWKATQLHNNKDSNTASPNSWALYQTWVKMDESLRETWIVAGKTIQSFAKVGQGGLQEMPVKITKTVVNNTNESVSPGRNAKDENDSTTHRAVTPAQKIVKKPVTIRSDAIGGVTQNKLPIGNTTKPLSRRAKRTVPNSDEVIEENAEKIVAKRFNPRRKMHEYLVKWEARTLEQNTWEPSSHLENVPHLLETFETQLARQKETRAALEAKQAALAAGKTAGLDTANKTETGKHSKLQSVSSSNNDNGESNRSAAGDVSTRPSRTSKTKAMDQVKQWVSGSNQIPSGAASPNGSDVAGSCNNSQDGEREWSMNTSNSSAVGTAGLKRKLEDSDFNDSNASDLPSTTATIEDLEEDLIPSHTVKRMKNGNAISIESKIVKVNGTSSSRTPTSVSGESLPVGPNSAEVIITQDANASGVKKKPGFNGNSRNATQKSEAQIRILSKGESAVSSTGIVRVGGGSDSGNESKTASSVTANRTQIRVGGSGTGTTTVGNTQINTISRQQHVQRTPAGTTLQRKTVMNSSTTQQQRGGTSMHVRSGVGNTTSSTVQQHASPTSGRMIIPRQGSSAHINRTTTTSSTKTVTPEQKILQLSKSGDLKVTKKVMTREDAIAQRMNLRQQQSQIQIQKVQQITPPTGGGRTSQVSAVSVRKQPDGTYAHEEQHQAQLCPITGKILGQDDQVLSQQSQSGVMHTQLMTGGEQQLALQQDHHQQGLQDIDASMLFSSDQMLTNEDGTPVLVTGEDGTVYQVAGKNAEGKTILVTQGPDGEQQFAYVAAADGDENQVLTLDNAVAEAVAQNPSELQSDPMSEPQYIVKTTNEDGTTQVVTMSEAELQQHQALAAAQQQQQQQADAGSSGVAVTASGSGATGQLCIQTSDGADGQEANIPAEVIQAGMPSPGGTRRVVLLLQDGTYMMTEMHDDEYTALNIAA
ncbi:biorientation of chromosomes in cell division protein 1-like 1 isoform X2 [Zeugodacus cucurbitae]|uniref:biorientation of chromosomes in cell division protein 1-like 1 isoform X2 n=1 Tax=Zeugodacus cucurbitae TaxID=28588 RepID=UPI0023D926A1|nr:biorientation of chromosomes in cell division protein 1-like 1 isoform X2 [Zeugodacus cucurbitae]